MKINIIEKIKKVSNDRVSLNLLISNNDFLKLSGYLNNVHVFSENNLEYNTRLIKRGKKENTKYILLPKGLREGLIPNNNVKCNKIETEDKYILIFSVDKLDRFAN